MSLSITQKLKKIKKKMPSYVPTRSCSEQDIEALKQAQQVVCLPELLYRLLLIIGEDGLGKLLLFEERFENVSDLKDQMIERFEATGLSYPGDIFFFHGNHIHDVYLFFRTRDCEDDPAVYSVTNRCFHKEATTLSEFLLNALELDQTKRRKRQENVRQTDYFYDPGTDEFFNLDIPEDSVLRIQKMTEVLLYEFRDKLEGCSGDEIERLRQIQAVICLPEVYIKLLKLMGKRGMDWVLYGQTTFKYLTGLKDKFVAVVRNDSLVDYPQDVFVFSTDHHQHLFFFFRTNDCENDPVVYAYEKQAGYYMVSASLAGFVLQQLDRNPQRIAEYAKRLEERRQLTLMYSSHRDEFLPLSPG